MSAEGEQAPSFCEQKEAKNFLNLGHGLKRMRCHTTDADSKKVFGFLFSKRNCLASEQQNEHR
jgi:hypothetical protein